MNQQSEHRSGFACFVGRPNAGKSTLTNAIIGSKIAIASSKPQTTRHAIRGIFTTDTAQLIIIDTPGLHRPRTLLGQRLNTVVRDTWTEVDVVGVCFPSDQRIGPGDAYLVEQIAELSPQPKLVALATKSDLVSRERLAKHLLAIQGLEQSLSVRWEQIIPVSAVTDDQVDLVTSELIKLLPQGPQLYPAGEITDEPDETRIAELIREAALEDLDDELPHSLMVVVDEMRLREDRAQDKPLMDIFATIVVERSSQKGIIIGHQGARLRQIRDAARVPIRELLGMPAYLALHVKVLKEWQRDAKQLNKLGF